MVNIVSGETFHIYDKNSLRPPKPQGWLSLKTMETKSITSCREPKASFTLPTAPYARAGRSACLP
jgi:hypothetical protein